jgi:hypothetical protein
MSLYNNICLCIIKRSNFSKLLRRLIPAFQREGLRHENCVILVIVQPVVVIPLPTSRDNLSALLQGFFKKRITTIRCVTHQKNAALIHFAVTALSQTGLKNVFPIQFLSTGNTTLCGGKYVSREVRVERVCFKLYSFNLQQKDDIFWSSDM